MASEAGYTVHEDATISRSKLFTCEELFVTGTAAEVTPIRQVGNIVIGNGSLGPVTEGLRSRFFGLVEQRTGDLEDWFTYAE